MLELGTIVDLLLWPSALSLIIFSYSFFRRISSRSSRRADVRLPPGPLGLPVVGSLFELGAKPNESLRRLSESYGPLMTLRLGRRTAVVVSSAEMAELCLQKNDRWFSGRTVLDAVMVDQHHEHSMVWNQVGPKWQELRRMTYTEVFSPKKLDAMGDLRERKVRELVGHVHRACREGRTIDVGRCAFVTSLNLVSNTFFSEDVVDLESESGQQFKDLVWGIMETAGRPNLSDYFPAIRWMDLQGIRRGVTGYFRQLHVLFDEMMDKRLSPDISSEARRTNDFLDVLQRRAGETGGSEFNRDTIKSLLTDMFVAGSDTSSSTVEWAMAELVRAPEKMATLRSEIREAIGVDRNDVEESDIPRLPYLQAVVKETLRLHPPVPLLIPHRAVAAVELAGFTIPENTQVLVNAWAIGRDPKVWEEPESFRPERFLGTGSEINFMGKDFKFIPFGAGRRICPGLPLAQRMVPLMLASLVHSFSWKLPGEMTTESQLDMEDLFGITLRKAVPLKIIPTCSMPSA